MVAVIAIWAFPSLAIILAISAWRRRWKTRTRLIVALVLLPIWALLLVGAYREGHYWDGYEFNPTIVESDLIGSWHFDTYELKLDANGTFSANDGSRGKWSLKPAALLYTNAQPWAVVRKDGELQLIKFREDDPDPDDWELSRAYSRAR